MNEDSAKKDLVYASKDRHLCESRPTNVDEGDANLLIKLAKLCSELKHKQQSGLGKIIDLIIKSMKGQNDNFNALNSKKLLSEQ